MSAPSDISSTGAEAKILRDIELAVRAGAAKALRGRASRQRKRAADGIASAGEQFSSIVVRSPEKLAHTFEMIANEIETEAVR